MIDLSNIHHNEEVQKALKIWVNKTSESLKNFNEFPSKNNLIELIGVWNRAIIYYDSIILEDPPNKNKNIDKIKKTK